MKESDFNYDSRQEDSEECAEARRVSRAHALPVGREPRAVSAPNSAAQFFEERAIDRKVGDARPYIPYEKGDSKLVREHWPESPRFAADIANQSSGIVIPRYPPAFMGLTHVPAELRPDTAVVTSSHYHFHGDEREGDLTIPTTGTRLPRKWIHSPEEMPRHIEKVHGGNNVQTVHQSDNLAKYVFSPGDGAKRLDMHPHGWIRLRKAPRVMFGIEGCIKADAMSSQDEAVFSVPAVTHWRAPELPAFAKRYLVGKVVYIIPDADLHNREAPGHTNVITQALLCRSELRSLGLEAHVAAPPAEEDSPRDANGKLILNGVDDFLVSGGTMDDLVVLERDTPRGLAEILAERNPRFRKDRVVRNAKLVEGLAIHADANGEIRAPLGAVARAMGLNRHTAPEALRDLHDEYGVVEIVGGTLETYSRHYDYKTKRYVGWEWKDRPAIRIIPELRAKDSYRRLGDE
jgi:hypothetical protein